MRKRLKPQVAVNILLDTEEFAALESICAFLRVRTCRADAKERADGFQGTVLISVKNDAGDYRCRDFDFFCHFLCYPMLVGEKTVVWYGHGRKKKRI